MAQQAEPGLTTRDLPPRRWQFLEGFPLRRVIQAILLILIVVGVTYGTWKTLTLPETSPRHFSSGAWRDLVVEGFALGSIYAMIALGYTMVYGVLLMINFAHGEVFMCGAFASFFVGNTLDSSGFLNKNPIASIAILLLVGMVVSAGVAVLLERVAYRPLRNAPRLVPLITAIGASLFLQNSVRGFFGAQAQGFPDIRVIEGTWKILGVPMQRTSVLTIVGAIVGLAGLTLFVARTKSGKSMRAVAEDKEIASLMGIDVDKVIVKTFAIGGMLAGMAGVLYAMVFSQVNPFMGFTPGIKAFTAAVLGGIGSIGGAAIGGLILGILEAVGPALFLNGTHVPSPNQLVNVVAFTILVLVLIFRPGGIFGAGGPEKV
jgi:branched-chain amino acid transport system permease protein